MLDLLLLILCLYGEARGEGIDGMIAVGNVIKNRTIVHEKTYKEVILQPYQFSYFNKGWELVKRDMNNFNNGDKISLENCVKVAILIYFDLVDDNTNGALFYHSVNVSPYWKSSVNKLITIKNHKFYN